MKLVFSVIGIISCLCVVAAAAADDDDGGLSGRGIKRDIHECIGYHLKTKGILAADVDVGNSAPSMCRILMGGIIPGVREQFEKKAIEKLPNEADCLMTEYDKNGIIDFILKVGFYQIQELSAAEKETIYAGFRTEGNTFRDTMAAACGLEANTFERFLESVYDRRYKTSKTPSETAN